MQDYLNLIRQSPILTYYLILNLGVALLYFLDKLKAMGRRWRISEKALLLPAIFGGAFGGLLGMQVFRHKTRHSNFWAVNGVFAALHLALLTYLFQKGMIP